eukprot:gene13515-biopygen20039
MDCMISPWLTTPMVVMWILEILVNATNAGMKGTSRRQAPQGNGGLIPKGFFCAQPARDQHGRIQSISHACYCKLYASYHGALVGTLCTASLLFGLLSTSHSTATAWWTIKK